MQWSGLFSGANAKIEQLLAENYAREQAEKKFAEEQRQAQALEAHRAEQLSQQAELNREQRTAMQEIRDAQVRAADTSRAGAVASRLRPGQTVSTDTAETFKKGGLADLLDTVERPKANLIVGPDGAAPGVTPEQQAATEALPDVLETSTFRGTPEQIQKAEQQKRLADFLKRDDLDPTVRQAIEASIATGKEFNVADLRGPRPTYQSKEMRLDGKDVPVNFDPATGTYHYNGQDVTSRVVPIPPRPFQERAMPQPQIFVGADGKPRALVFQNGQATEIALPGDVTGKSQPTEIQAKSAGYAARMAETAETIDQYDTLAAKSTFRLDRNLPREGQSAEVQQYIDSKDNWIAAQLRQESGAAIGPKEYADADNQYFPQPGDTAANIDRKRKLRQTAERTMIRTSGPLASGITSTGGSTAAGAPKVGDTKTFPNGRKARFDGKGWVAQ